MSGFKLNIKQISSILVLKFDIEYEEETYQIQAQHNSDDGYVLITESNYYFSPTYVKTENKKLNQKELENFILDWLITDEGSKRLHSAKMIRKFKG